MRTSIIEGSGVRPDYARVKVVSTCAGSTGHLQTNDPSGGPAGGPSAPGAGGPWEVVILGGGAAGLWAAGTAARRGRRVLLLEKNRRVGVKILASGGGAWWSTRMEAGREELMALLKRLDGRFIPDSSPERMSDYEAMRIHIYHDQQVEERVSRRFETYGASARSQRSITVSRMASW